VWPGREDHRLLIAQKESVAQGAIEPKWVHGKRGVIESERLLTAHELAKRVCAAFGCPHYEHLYIAENAA
jgi:hypothetical protein